MPSGSADTAPESYITPEDRKKSYSDLGVARTLDPLTNKGFLGQLGRRGALYLAVAAATDLVILVLGLILSAVRPGFDSLKAVGSASVFLVLGMTLVFLLLPVPALLGEWSRLLSFQAPAADKALDLVRDALDRHAIPSDKLEMESLSPPGEADRHYLELRQGFFAGFVSCFAHGQDLYVGWTYWIDISPVRVLMMAVTRRTLARTGRGNHMYQALRYESAKATIAVIHACTTEGVEAATSTPRIPAGQAV